MARSHVAGFVPLPPTLDIGPLEGFALDTLKAYLPSIVIVQCITEQA